MMKSFPKRAIAVLLALCLLAASPALSALAQEPTSGTETIVTETQQTSSAKSTYRYKYTVGTPTGVSGADYMWTLGTASSPREVVLRYDLHDATVSFKPYVNGQRNCNTLIDVYASKDGATWYQLVDAQYVGTGSNRGFIADTATFVAPADVTNKPWGGTAWGYYDWDNYNNANMTTVLTDNPQKVVYLKFTNGGAPASGTEASELQGFGITGVWNETGYETYVGEVHNRDDLSGCGSVHTDDAGRAKENYFNQYLVANESTYTALNGSLIKLGGNYAKNGYLTFKYDLNDETTAFYPYLYTAGDYTAELSVYASKDGVAWLPLVLRERLSKGQYRGDDASFKPHADVDNVGTLTAWPNYDVDNMQLILVDNPQKTVYLKFIYSGTGVDEAQVSALGITSTYDTVPYRDPSLPTGSTSVVLREELLAATDNRDGYEGTDKNSTTYLNQYLVSEQCAYTPLYHLVKLTKGNKMVMKFDLNDLTESFTPWMKVGGDKYSVVRLRGSKDGRNWVDLATGVPAAPGTTYGTVTAWPQFDDAAAAALLTDNTNKVVYLSFEYQDGALNPQTGKRDEETQLHGIGIIGEHAATALNAEITAVGKTEYAINDEELDIANSIISVTYDTDETIAYAFADADVRGFIPAMLGEQTIYVEKHGLVASYANAGEGTVYDHLKRAIDFSLNHMAAHGMPAGLYADWNDCLRMGERGESTFVAMQLYQAMTILADYAVRRNDITYAAWLCERFDELSQAIQQHCWDEDRFIRGIRADGVPVGRRTDAEANMWLNPQSWGVITGIATDEQAALSMQRVHERLNTPYGACLLDPPYREHAFDGALMLLFNESTKENGGIFSQPQGWLILAESLLGHGDRAYEYFRESSPACMNDRAEIRVLEPYVHGQFTESKCSPFAGRSHVHWLTGTASTVMVGCVEGICGIRPAIDHIDIRPAIPSHWQRMTMEKVFRGKRLHITVENPNARQGKRVVCTVNGTRLEDSRILISMLTADTDITVELL